MLETLIDIDPDEELADDEIEALVETFEEVVEAEAFDQLDLDQIGALGDQVNEAPDEVKVVFEETTADEMLDGTLTIRPSTPSSTMGTDAP